MPVNIPHIQTVMTGLSSVTFNRKLVRADTCHHFPFAQGAGVAMSRAASNVPSSGSFAAESRGDARRSVITKIFQSSPILRHAVNILGQEKQWNYAIMGPKSQRPALLCTFLVTFTFKQGEACENELQNWRSCKHAKDCRSESKARAGHGFHIPPLVFKIFWQRAKRAHQPHLLDCFAFGFTKAR